VAIITRLLDAISPLVVKVERLYLDRGFYSVPVIRYPGCISTYGIMSFRSTDIANMADVSTIMWVDHSRHTEN
jgi:hypothetical protein